MRYNDCFQNDKGRRAYLVRHAINLDKYTMMNSTYTNPPFSDKTISKVISYPSIQVGAKLNSCIKHKSQWHKSKRFIKSCITATTPMEVQQKFASLKYQITVHGLFTERLSNQRRRLTQVTYNESCAQINN